MLRSWTERIRVYLHPEQVVMVRQTGILKPRVTVKQVIPITAQGEHPWGGAVAALATALKQPEWQHARASVTLAGPLMHYRTAPWDGSLTPEERQALLRHRFEEVYGEVTRTWQLAIADAGFSRQGLACAFDSRLLTALQTTFSSSTARLVSVRPLLMTVFNRWRQQINGKNAWFVLAEPSYLTVALLQNGEWRGIRHKACVPDWEGTLGLVLEREALHLGLDAAAFPVYCCRPDKPAFKPALSPQQPVQLLRLPNTDGFSPEGDKHIALALC